MSRRGPVCGGRNMYLGRFPHDSPRSVDLEKLYKDAQTEELDCFKLKVGFGVKIMVQTCLWRTADTGDFKVPLDHSAALLSSRTSQTAARL